MGTEKIKILMAVCNYFDPDNRVYRAADALNKEGYEVHLLAYHKENLAYNKTMGSGFKLTRLSLKTPIKTPKQLANYFKYNSFRFMAKRVADKIKPDAVHCHDYNTLFLGIYCKNKFGSKLIYDNHEFFQDLSYLHRYPKWIRKNIASYEKNTVNKWIDMMIVVSDGIAKEYNKLTGIEPIVIRNIPDFKGNNDSNKEIFDNFGLQIAKNEGKELLIYLGTNFSRGRGLSFIIALIKSLPDKYILYNFGCKDENEVNHLKITFEKENILHRVRIFEYIPLNELFQLGPYFSYGLSIIEPIYFSYKHSLPNKLFEYIMMGIPVIVSDIPEQSKLVREYDIGIIAKLDHVANVAKQILNDKIDRKPAIIKARKELNWQIEKKKLIAVYELLFY